MHYIQEFLAILTEFSVHIFLFEQVGEATGTISAQEGTSPWGRRGKGVPQKAIRRYRKNHRFRALNRESPIRSLSLFQHLLGHVSIHSVTVSVLNTSYLSISQSMALNTPLSRRSLFRTANGDRWDIYAPISQVSIIFWRPVHGDLLRDTDYIARKRRDDM
jgi:hypothetical protein